jgi:hypothetical protein
MAKRLIHAECLRHTLFRLGVLFLVYCFSRLKMLAAFVLVELRATKVLVDTSYRSLSLFPRKRRAVRGN